MLIRKPRYYDEFKCLAEACPRTCCAGWAVVIDEATQKKYKAMEGNLGQRIRSEMKEDDGEIIFPLRDGRCPFLNNKNLCDIQAATDEATLCKTCRMFPRFVYEFGLLREMGLSLSCPEAARLIMSSGALKKTKGLGDASGEVCDTCDAELIDEQTDEGITEYNDIDPELYMRLTKYRKDLFLLIQNKENSLDEKVEEIMSVAACFAGEKEKELNREQFVGKCLETCEKLESIDEDWEILCSSLEGLQGKEQNVLEIVPSPEEKRELENILFYYIYKYFLSAVFDGNVAGKLLISVFCFYIILSGYVIRQPKTEKERRALVCDISREVEHSQFNLDVVEKEMAEAIKEYKKVF